MSATLKDVAKKLNISVSTVSRVVNDKSYVSPKTREKVLKALEEMNYSPNQVARSLKKKSTNTIGIVVPDISEVFFAHVIKGIDEVLSNNGYSIILCDTGEKPEKEELYLNLLIEKQIDGIILATVSKKHVTLQRIIDKALPVIFIDNLPNLKRGYDSVMIDNSKASYIAVEHLIKLGHRNIGIITGKQDETTGYERLLGYKKALQDNNIKVDENLITIGDFKEKSGYENMKILLERNKDITAVYVVSSKMTYGAIKAITERGLKIPKDIALVGFDVHDPSGLITPSITTMIQPEEHIGQVAAELILKRLKENGERHNQKIILEPELLIRDSCGGLNVNKCK
ncbi:MAG: LacI family DNA-binding transcriptional regulator [Firmicutes bacterium]|nr:LacI family DNA-binding transcriptional regulator [Bacillota bacterium]